MNSISENHWMDDAKETIPWIPFLLFMSMFFFTSHDLYYSLMENFNKPVDAYVKSTHGNIINIISYLAFGIMSIFIVIQNGLPKLQVKGLKWLLIAYVTWCFLTILWSDDPFLTFKRFTEFSIIALGAMAMNARNSINLIPKFVFSFTVINLAIGISAELILGTFHPSVATYRFSGTIHPNSQGLNCALMFLSALCLLQDRSYGAWARRLLMIACIVAFAAMVLTKSRTAIIAALVAYTLFWLFTKFTSKKFFIIGLVVSSCCLFLVFVGNGLLHTISQDISQFRVDDPALQFGGRPFIWKTALRYVAENPLFGYGYSSFWTVPRIKEISNFVGMGLIDSHSLYIDTLLNIGLIGLSLYLAIIFVGLKLAYEGIKRTGQIGFSFIFILAVFILIHGSMETAMIHSPGTLFLAWGLLFLASQRVPEPIQEKNFTSSANLAPARY